MKSFGDIPEPVTDAVVETFNFTGSVVIQWPDGKTQRFPVIPGFSIGLHDGCFIAGITVEDESAG